jgi:hypothetical protein
MLRGDFMASPHTHYVDIGHPFPRSLIDDISHIAYYDHYLGYGKELPEYSQFIKQILAGYLSYVNANLVISNTLGLGIHDWYDFLPFYREKVMSVGQESTREQKQVTKMNQLFDIAFPDFRIWDTHSLLKALKDKRIRDLRQLVDEAVRGKVEFNEKFARRALAEVFKRDMKLQRFRKVVSYITMPLGLIPYAGTLVQKGAEESAVYLQERRLKKEFRWFYLISELGSQAPPEGSTVKQEGK